MDALNVSFLLAFVAEKDIAKDKSFWKFQRQLAFKTFNLSKRAKFRLKVKKLCASTCSAAEHTCFKVFTELDHGDMPSSTQSVLQLMETDGFLDFEYSSLADISHLLRPKGRMQ